MNRILPRLAAILGVVAAMIGVSAPPAAAPTGDNAERWFVSQRAFPGREIPAGALDRAIVGLRALAKSRASLALPGGNWTSIGPEPINDPSTRSTFSGRVAALATHPTDPNTLYLGADAGGVWKSVDGGQTWSNVTPDLTFPAIRSLVIDPVNPDIVYAAVPPSAYGSRLLRSTDAGRTWQDIPLKDERGQAVTVLYKILIDPRHAGSPSTTTLYLQRGGWLYRTDDGGKTLQTVLAMPDAGLVPNTGPEFLEDVVLDPAHPDSLFVLSVPYVCPAPCSNPDPAIVLYRSIDGGGRWTRQRITGSTDVVPTSRIVASAGADNLLVAFEDTTAQKLRLMRSTDLGDTWSELPTPRSTSLAWPTTLALSPTTDTVYLGNLGLNRSTNWGQTWTDMGALHADETVVAFDAASRLLLGSDGGAFRAGASAGLWTSLNNALSITECYAVAAHPKDSSRILIGTQDNGTIERQGDTGWSRIVGGDGGDVLYDPVSPVTTSYVETQWDSGTYNFIRCVDGGTCVRRVNGLNLADVAPFIPRFTMDPSVPTTLFLTAEHLYRTDNAGALWSAATDSVKNQQRCWQSATLGRQCAAAGYFTAVAVARTSSNVVYAGTRNGDVWVSTNRGSSWKSVAGPNAGPLPVRSVTQIAVDPDDARAAYVVFGGFDASGAGRGHVFRTSDGGDTWRDLSGNLPDIHVSTLLVDPDAKPRVVYIGTDFGVFRSTDDGSGNWESYNSGLPPVIVTQLAYNAGTRTLLASTYGRGVWAISDRFSSPARR